MGDDATFFKNPSRTLPLDVRVAERLFIKRRRDNAFGVSDDGKPIMGVCLSGGGVRSATFCYGALKGLQESGAMPHVDYLSTVSGGGYIGGCISALFAQEGVSTRSPTAPPFNREAHKYLREHASVQAPRHGPLARDTLRLIGAAVFGTFWSLIFFGLAFTLTASMYLMMLNQIVGHQVNAHTVTELEILQLFHPEARWQLLAAAAMIGFGFQVALQMVIGLLTKMRVRQLTNLAEAPDADGLESVNLRRERRDELADERELDAERSALVGLGLAMNTLFVVLVWLPRQLPWVGDAFALSDHDLYGLFVGPGFFFGGFAASFLVQTFFAGPGGGIASLGDGESVRGEAWVSRSFNHAALGFSLYILIASLVFIPLTYALLQVLDHGGAVMGGTAVSSLGALVVGRVLASADMVAKLPPFFRGLVLEIAQLAAIVIMTALGTVTASLMITWYSVPPGWVFLVTLALFAGLGVVINLNRVSLHGTYRDRLADAYLSSPVADLRRRKLSDLDDAAREHGASGPLHLVNCALNLTGSRDLAMRDRKCDHFTLSPVYCGSARTGFVRTARYRGGLTLLSSAMAISGAAASTQMGVYGSRISAFLLACFNIRMGTWYLNPMRYAGDNAYVRQQRYLRANAPTTLVEQLRAPSGKPTAGPRGKEGMQLWPWFLGREAFAKTVATSGLVNLSDGGHTGDNLGLYALLQRRCRLIIAIDAGHDPHLRCTDLVSALQQAEVDESIRVSIDLENLRPVKLPSEEDGRTLAGAQFAVGRILYPEDDIDIPPVEEALLGHVSSDLQEQDLSEGAEDLAYLIYLKAALVGDEPEATRTFSFEEPEFPHRTTADQFFTGRQFEAYRALGHHVARTVLGTFQGQSADDLLEPSAEQLMRFCQRHLGAEPPGGLSAFGSLGLTSPRPAAPLLLDRHHDKA